MVKLRVLRGTYRREDGTRAEPGDVIDIPEERADRLNPESYKRVDADTDDETEPPADEESEAEPDDEPVDEPDSGPEPDADVDSDDDEVESEPEPEPELEPETTDSDSNPLIDHPSVTDGDENTENEDTTDASYDDVEASGDVPDDYQTLSKMAKHYNGEEVHGSMSGDELSAFFEELSDTEIASLKDAARAELAEE